MDQFIKVYKKVLKYRKYIAVGTSLYVMGKNSGRNFLPEYLILPQTATLDCLKYPGEYQRWLIRITKRDCEYEGDIFPYVTKCLTETVSGGFQGFGFLKPTCFIGIPKTFYCSNMLEVCDIDLRFIAGKSIGVNSKSEEQFLNSLVLSDSAQKFAIARHLMYFKDNWAIIESLLSPIFVFFGYILCMKGPNLLVNNRGSLSIAHLFRFHLLAIGFTWILCKLTWSQLMHIITFSVDQKAASISKEYSQGAVEYYAKERDFNMATRILLGNKGERFFTALGNRKDGVFVNWHGPTTTEKQKQVKKIYEKFENSDENL